MLFFADNLACYIKGEYNNLNSGLKRDICPNSSPGHLNRFFYWAGLQFKPTVRSRPINPQPTLYSLSSNFLAHIHKITKTAGGDTARESYSGNDAYRRHTKLFTLRT